MEKLNASINSNKGKLEFLEEDYLKWKNQIDQIEKVLHEYNSEIQELTKQKKECFNQINIITLQMSEDFLGSKKDIKRSSAESNNTLPNSEKIKNLQKEAKEKQLAINKIKSKINITQLKLEEITPIFESYKKDYQKLLKLIEMDEKKMIRLQSELKNRIKGDIDTEFHNIDSISLELLNSPNDIEEKIEKVNYELNKISIPRYIYEPQNPFDLSLITQKLITFDEEIKNLEPEIIIDINENDLNGYFDQFKKLEDILSGIQFLTNKFLPEVNLNSHFRILVNNVLLNFFIDIEFVRNDKEHINFENLTTPEKIFFIIIFYISINLYFKKENIIFSNVSILSKYNKAGSIYRTIRKILPIFETDDSLSKFYLIFIITNLDLKKEIKNLRIKTILES